MLTDEARINLRIYAGDPFSQELQINDVDNPGDPEDDWTLTPVDLTAYTITGSIKTSRDSASALASFTVTKTDAAAGKITISLTNVQTAALPPKTKVVYDLKFVEGSSAPQRWVFGDIEIVKPVTG